MKYLVALVLYLIFSVTSAFAGLIGLFAAPLSPHYTANVMHAMDTLLAALLGYDGRSTVSKECGRKVIAGKACRFCRFVCRFLNYVDPRHCEREAA